jgi:hypothetical protein
VATADLYPKISLGGSIGSTSFGFGDAFGASALRWLAGPLISWSFPNQARIRARIGVARADSQAALASFDGSVLQALSETETALSNYARALDRRIALASARDQAERAVRIVRRSSAKGRSIIFPSWTRNARSPTRRPNWQTATRGSRMRRLIFSGRCGGWQQEPTQKEVQWVASCPLTAPGPRSLCGCPRRQQFHDLGEGLPSRVGVGCNAKVRSSGWFVLKSQGWKAIVD